MKSLKFIALALFLFGCKTKTVTVEKTLEKDKELYAMHFDSLIKVSIKTNLAIQSQQSIISDQLVLSSISQLDSFGNRKPFHYKHYVDGQLKEEIFLEGGDINKKTDTQEALASEKVEASKFENTRVDVDVGIKKEAEKSKVDKNKKAVVTGFQFGFYLWLFLIIVVLIILNWVSKKFKLPDKLKTLLGTKEG